MTKKILIKLNNNVLHIPQSGKYNNAENMIILISLQKKKLQWVQK